MRLRLSLVAACAAVLAAAPSASASHDPRPPALDWQPCGAAANVSCTTIKVPRDYERPWAGSLQLFAAKSPATDPARRIGTLFVNFGGPGVAGAEIFQALGATRFPALNARFDIVAVDPRGVGQSRPSIDCKVNQETEGINARPFTTPDNLDAGALIAKDKRYIARCVALNRDVLPYVSTASNARDIDLIRRALGERKISFLGFSYGSFLGTTYAGMFPAGYRAMALDGPVDAAAWINDPLRSLSAQSAGFERALRRFLATCARDRGICRGFGGSDPWDSYEDLIAKLDTAPVPAPDGRLVDADVARAGTQVALYNPVNWGFIGQALLDLQNGDGARMRRAADLGYGLNPDGSYQPQLDRYFTISASEQNYPRDLGVYWAAGQRSWDEHDHYFWNNGYVELNWALFPIRSRDVFRGPFRLPAGSATPLVVARTYDPATPYRGARNLVRDLGNARLLTMHGDGHTSYGGDNTCVDAAVETYLTDGTLPPVGTHCRADVGAVAARAAVPAEPEPAMALRR